MTSVLAVRKDGAISIAFSLGLWYLQGTILPSGSVSELICGKERVNLRICLNIFVFALSNLFLMLPSFLLLVIHNIDLLENGLYTLGVVLHAVLG